MAPPPCSQTHSFRPLTFLCLGLLKLITYSSSSFINCNLYLLRLPIRKDDEFGSLVFPLNVAKIRVH